MFYQRATDTVPKENSSPEPDRLLPDGQATVNLRSQKSVLGTFTRFSLQDCRPMAVTDKLERGDLDTKTATGHTSDKMIATVYDRRPQRVATGAKLGKNTEK